MKKATNLPYEQIHFTLFLQLLIAFEFNKQNKNEPNLI